MEVPAQDSLEAVASPPARRDTEESEQINLEMAAVEKNIDVLRTEMLQMQKEEESKVELQVDIETIVEQTDEVSEPNPGFEK